MPREFFRILCQDSPCDRHIEDRTWDALIRAIPVDLPTHARYRCLQAVAEYGAAAIKPFTNLLVTNFFRFFTVTFARSNHTHFRSIFLSFPFWWRRYTKLRFLWRSLTFERLSLKDSLRWMYVLRCKVLGLLCKYMCVWNKKTSVIYTTILLFFIPVATASHQQSLLYTLSQRDGFSP